MLERRAEEVLSQEELAPRRWAERLAPDDLPDFAGFEVGRVYQPGTGLMAGDFYDVFRVAPSRVAAVIGDVTGHGIEPSITAFQAKYLLRVFLRQYRDPAQALELLNAQMGAQARPEEFISLLVSVFDTEAGTLRFASAGHPAAWLWHDREVQPLRATGPLLLLDPDGELLQPRDHARPRRPAAHLHRRAGRRRATASRCSARSASPASCDATQASIPTCCARRSSRRHATSRRRRSTTTSPVLAIRTRRDRCTSEQLTKATERALAGNLDAGRDKLAAQHKLFVRDRLALLLDEGSFVEDALLANAMAPAGDLPADGVVTGVGRVDGRAVCVMANDPTVKAGSWGARTVEKIVRAHRARAAPRAADRLARRLGRRSHHRPGRAVPRARGARVASSTTRCACRVGCRRCAACSVRRPRAARTSRASATS